MSPIGAWEPPSPGTMSRLSRAAALVAPEASTGAGASDLTGVPVAELARLDSGDREAAQALAVTYDPVAVAPIIGGAGVEHRSGEERAAAAAAAAEVATAAAAPDAAGANARCGVVRVAASRESEGGGGGGGAAVPKEQRANNSDDE